MRKHTPGPWSAHARTVTAPETEDRLGLHVQINGGNREDNKVNARLIAAAPDLLAALEMARNGLQWYQDEYPEAADGSDDEAMAEIDAAIAKATGATS